MFEYGMRLGREVRTLRGLQKQGNCFLAALNCLRLIRPEYAWIVQPAAGAVVGNTELPGKSLGTLDGCICGKDLPKLFPRGCRRVLATFTRCSRLGQLVQHCLAPLSADISPVLVVLCFSGAGGSRMALGRGCWVGVGVLYHL